MIIMNFHILYLGSHDNILNIFKIVRYIKEKIENKYTTS